MKNESSIKVMKELVDIIAKLNERIEELEAVKPQHPNPALENVLAKLRDFYNCCVKDAHDKDAILVDIGARITLMDVGDLRRWVESEKGAGK